MAEQQFFSAPGVQVTSSRFVTGGQTIALANITSVNHAPPNRAPGILLAIIGVVLTAFLPPVGIVLLIVGVLAAVLAKATLVLVTAAGEVRPLKAKRETVEAVVTALNEAIIARG